jgi:hypothetical protein
VALAVGLAIIWIEIMATDQIDVAPFTHSLDGWTFLPPVVAIALAEPLVDGSPQLTELATRSRSALAGARLLLAYGGGLAVAADWLLSAGGGGVAQHVLVLLSVATVAVAALRRWYWVPLLPLLFCWLQLAPPEYPLTQWCALPAPATAGSVIAAWLGYMGAAELRATLERRR